VFPIDCPKRIESCLVVASDAPVSSEADAEAPASTQKNNVRGIFHLPQDIRSRREFEVHLRD
jgi:hypothetical protein